MTDPVPPLPGFFLMLKSLNIDIFCTIFSSQSLSDRVRIEVIPIDLSNVDSIQSARSILAASIEKSAEVAEGPSALGASFFKAWGEIPTGLPRALLTPVRSSLIRDCFYCHRVLHLKFDSC